MMETVSLMRTHGVMQTEMATSTMMEDCRALEEKYQDSNGDGKPCNPGDFGVDEDFSEVELTNLINNREIYLIPLLNTDGFIYDQTVFCPAPAWESCPAVDGERT